MVLFWRYIRIEQHRNGISVDLNLISLPQSLMPTTLCLTTCVCCLHRPYVYREFLELASIDKVLALGRPVRQQVISRSLKTYGINPIHFTQY
jgi:hypothetical protein